MTESRVAVVTRMQRAVIGELTRDGASNAQIAKRLYISVDTVKIHIKGALKATGEPTRTSLAVALLRGRVLLHTVSSRRWAGEVDAA